MQSEKARKFLDLREELKSLEIGLFIHNIEDYKGKIEEILKDREIFESQNSNEELRLNDMQTSKDRLKAELDELIQKIEETQNLGFEASTKIEKINSDINLATGKIENNKENYERYGKEIDELAVRISELEEEKNNRLEKKTDLFSNKEKFAKELEEKEKELEEAASKLSVEESEIEEKKKKAEEHTDLKYEKKALINTQEVNYENLEKREKQVKNEVSLTISELDATKLGKEEKSQGFYTIDGKRKEISKKLDDIKEKKEKVTSKIKEYEDEINKLSDEFRVKDSKLKFLIDMEREKEGYARSVKTLLLACEKNSSLRKGVHDVLANLISVSKEHETAIEMALRRKLTKHSD
ncbi:MAG: hypothetical protein FWC79_06450 [Oscillospiraceae bacterium]|nr:hypothetical protein [Oscillospiraceae bacterium]